MPPELTQFCTMRTQLKSGSKQVQLDFKVVNVWLDPKFENNPTRFNPFLDLEGSTRFNPKNQVRLKVAFFSKNVIRFSDLQISKIKIFQITILSLKFVIVFYCY